MYWIYILKCKHNVFYVGQTSRLYRRFWEHHYGKGGVNTSIYTPESIVAIYKVYNIMKFMDYNKNVIDINNDESLKSYYTTGFNNPDYILHNWDGIDNYVGNGDELTDANIAENNIAECMMIHNKDNWQNIRGGKYVKFDCEYKFPNNEYMKEIPLCKCGLPCDVKKDNDKKSLFFRCAKKNMWRQFKEDFQIEDEPCNFYREYITDIELRVGTKKKFNNRKEQFGKLMKESSWLRNVPCEEEYEVGQCILCNKYVWCDRQGNYRNNGITYNNERRLLCCDCFVNKNEELKKKYSLLNIGKCFVPL